MCQIYFPEPLVSVSSVTCLMARHWRHSILGAVSNFLINFCRSSLADRLIFHHYYVHVVSFASLWLCILVSCQLLKIYASTLFFFYIRLLQDIKLSEISCFEKFCESTNYIIIAKSTWLVIVVQPLNWKIKMQKNIIQGSKLQTSNAAKINCLQNKMELRDWFHSVLLRIHILKFLLSYLTLSMVKSKLVCLISFNFNIWLSINYIS